MSRIGKAPISIPSGVEIKVAPNNEITVKGPKGELKGQISNKIKVDMEDGTLTVARSAEDKESKSQHGLARTIINNMVVGVTEGYEKKLEAVGVGYRFTLKGNDLSVTAGYSHPVELKTPSGIKLESPSNTELFVRGIDKQAVGEFAANVRKIRKPEPYKGKGIRYADEQIIRKVGKKAA